MVEDAEINIVEEKAPLTEHEKFVESLRDRQTQPVKAYVPPARTKMQRTQLEEEQAAGRKRVKYFQQQQKQRPQPQPAPEDGVNVPVYRPPEPVSQLVEGNIKRSAESRPK